MDQNNKLQNLEKQILKIIRENAELKKILINNPDFFTRLGESFQEKIEIAKSQDPEALKKSLEKDSQLLEELDS